MLACAVGSRGRPASEAGSLCHGDGGESGGARALPGPGASHHGRQMMRDSACGLSEAAGDATRPARERGGRLLGLAVISASLLVTDSGAQAPQACPSSIPLYELIPYTWPCPIGVPQCHTAYGLCLWPLEVPAPHLGTVDARAPVLPGQPCSCVARNGARVPGVIRVGARPHH